MSVPGPRGPAARPRRVVRVDGPASDPGLLSRMRGRGHWLWSGAPLPKGTDGLTLGPLVLIRRVADPTGFSVLLRHEQTHVAQFRELGVRGFVMSYFGAYLRWRLRGYDHLAAYRRIPLEVEARVVARAEERRLCAPR